jgi:Uma2 family endonuclease
MALAQNRIYTIDDIYALPDGVRAELINGQIYNMAPPSRKHQDITGHLYRKIADYIDQNHGSCRPSVAPFAVRPTGSSRWFPPEAFGWIT